MMENKLYSKQEVIDFINQGRVLLLSGSEKALSDLPAGKWISGTTPYFMDTVGKINEDMIFVDDFTLIAKNAKVATYDKNSIKDIAVHGFQNGFIVVTMPIETDVYYEFSNYSLEYESIFNNPVVGYVSCMKLEDYGKVKSKTGSGINGKLSEELASVLYVELPDHLAARAEIINLDTIDESTPEIVFPKNGFVQSDCTIDGKSGNISEYFENVVKPKLGGYTQLITSQNGALINRDPKVVNVKTGETSFYSPIYAGDVYHLVKNGLNYRQLFNEKLKAKHADIAACISCVSYFFGGNFMGSNIVKNGVYAFGEIAYQILNKTIVTLEIDNVD